MRLGRPLCEGLARIRTLMGRTQYLACLLSHALPRAPPRQIQTWTIIGARGMFLGPSVSAISSVGPGLAKSAQKFRNTLV